MELIPGGNRLGRIDSTVADSKVIHEHKRTVRGTRLAAATLACDRCDAPIAIGPEPLSVVDKLVCPYCEHRGTARDFLSLEVPTRPAHVVVRVSYRRVRTSRT